MAVAALSWLAALSIFTATAEEVPAPIVPTSRIELFNHKDFTGWTFYMRDNADPTRTWSITNNVIHCSGKPNGYLRTEKTYRDYELTVFWRFVRVATNADNTGVLVHLQSPDQLWPPCVQYQGRFGKQGDFLLMNGAESKEHRGKEANTALPRRAGLPRENVAGEVNVCQVICRGDTVEAYLNGERVNETTECTVSAGFIGFQCEGGEYEINRVILDPLKSSAVKSQ
jgi:3-keto-disaccharide hydrolase